MKRYLYIAIFINFYLTIFFIPLFNLDEGAFSEATREMLENKDFITTYLNGNLRFDKPILIYWLQALSATIFGLNEFAMRLPSAIAATIWAYVIYLFASRVYNKEIGIISAFLMVTSLQISLIAKAAIADSLLNMFLALSMYNLYLFINTNENKRLYYTFAFIALGTLTKGPVAILIPLATYFIYSLLKRDLKRFFKTIFNPKGLIIFSTIALPWYIIEYIQQGEKFIEGFFLKHNIKRFSTSLEDHAGSIFYFIPVILIGLLPYTSLFLKYLKNIRDFEIFGTIWFLFVFIFFSLSGTKLPHYVIYGYTPLFIFMAYLLSYVKNEFLYSLPFAIFVGILIILPFILQNLYLFKDPLTKGAIIAILPYFNKIYFGVMFSILFLTLMKFGIKTKTVIMGFATIIIVNYIGWIYAHIRAIPIKEAAKFIQKNNINLYYYHLNTPSLSFYLKKIIKTKKPQINEIVITNIKTLKRFENFEILYKNGIVVIAKIKPKSKKTNPFNYKKDKRE